METPLAFRLRFSSEPWLCSFVVPRQKAKSPPAKPEFIFAQTLRACPKIARGPAARDFGCGQGGEVRASPTRAVRTEPTQATDKRPAARRVFAPKAAWLRCSSVEDPGRIFSFVAPRHPAFGAKTGPRGIFGHALRPLQRYARRRRVRGSSLKAAVRTVFDSWPASRSVRNRSFP